ncbi:thrombospondin type-1 domain-containing protein 4-like [Anopheles aquasalis]|uniref:thrombospondin type-1 domain-containing protein 4-like n=1 Tax=Anopheles aquasalis TaxID=42839 RepID=UPI00215ACDFF|nr:thrombospondin type-1 domain-containing protein 4-like [Anopheles aquasalis]
MILFRFVCCIAAIVVIDPIGADLATRERIRIHREWLERRAAKRSNASGIALTTSRTAYMRKLIKFKNENEPLSENDVSFVPHFEIGGGNGAVGTDNGADVGYPSRPEKELLTGDAERYRYEIVSEHEAAPTEASLREKSRASSPSVSDPTNPLVYVIQPAVEMPTESLGQHLSGHEVTKSIGAATQKTEMTERIDAIVKVNHNANQNQNVENERGAEADDSTSGYKFKTTTDRDHSETTSVASSSEHNHTTNGQQSLDHPASGLEHRDPQSSSSVDVITVRHLFGPWSNWTPCSRSCGGGVKMQYRACLKREYINGKKSTKAAVESFECIGIIKRYHLCNEQDCPPSDGDFRDQQCTSFNNQSFEGKRYIWEAFVKEDAECELNCKPIGMRYFATLNKTVIDGTSCIKPTDYFRRSNGRRGICVEGVCKAVHNSGVISGTFMNNGAVRCGSTVCRTIHGIYTKTNPDNGYVHVATIPAGASNVTITELQHSQNYLALKANDQQFFINGDYTISLSGQYTAAGTVFDYHRLDGLSNGSKSSLRNVEGITEWVTAVGPTSEPVQIFLLSQYTNPGVKYEYLLPVSANPQEPSSSVEDPIPEVGNEISEKANVRIPKQRLVASQNNNGNTTARGPRKRKYLWKVIGFSACSKSCGGGVQQPIIKCVRESPTKVFSVKRCAHLQQPILNENLMRCNTQPCPAYWKLGEWSQCNCEEKYDEVVLRTREVKCVQELLSGIVIQVNSGACMDDVPSSTESCECSRVIKPTTTPAPQVEPPRYKPTTGSNQHHRGHRGHQQHSLHHSTERSDRNALVSTQNDGSSSPATVISRDHGRQRQDMSHIHHRAESKKTGVWLTANWSARCSTTCGVGLQTRSIFCDRSSSHNSERCDLRLMPETSRECTSDRACEFGEWFTGPWTLCSGDCFNLTRSRSVLCIRNEHIAQVSECDATTRPISNEPCDSEAFEDCKPRWHYSEWTECTKPCGGGNQRRVVKCLEFNLRAGMLQESVSCRYADRPTAYRVCNEDACPSTTATTAPTASSSSTSSQPSMDSDDYSVDLMLNDGDCRDEFPNCSVVVKARLCGYDYYKQACCVTCRQQRN